MASITLLPYSYSDNSGMTDPNNLSSENGEAHGIVANGETNWVTLLYQIPNKICQLTSGITINLQCKSSRSNKTLYSTRPRIDWVKYGQTVNGTVQYVTRSLGWYGGQINGKNWTSYSVADNNGAPFTVYNNNSDDISTIYVRVGVNKNKGALNDFVYLRNCKITVNYQEKYGTHFYVDTYTMPAWNTIYCAAGASITTPNPTKDAYNLSGWYTGTTIGAGNFVAYGGTAYKPTATVTQLNAHWSIKTFAITTSAGTGGTITATSTVNYGDGKTITITPNSGYIISNVTVDGISQGAISNYTFSNVTAAHSISATFAAIAPPQFTSASITPNHVNAGQGYVIAIGVQ